MWPKTLNTVIKSLIYENEYNTKTTLTEAEFERLKKRTKELFDKIRLELERFVLGTNKLGQGKLG